MIVHVLTAVTRPANLSQICTSIRKAAIKAGVSIIWHWRFDPECEHVGGQHLKNEMLHEVPDEDWVYILDDDTIVHPELFSLVSDDVEAIVVTQPRPGGGDLIAAPHNNTVGKIDIGQVLFRKSIAAGHTIPPEYTGDGKFLSEILRGRNVRYVDEPLSYYNKLRP